jgi:hypothetical protein
MRVINGYMRIKFAYMTRQPYVAYTERNPEKAYLGSPTGNRTYDTHEINGKIRLGMEAEEFWKWHRRELGRLVFLLVLCISIIVGFILGRQEGKETLFLLLRRSITLLFFVGHWERESSSGSRLEICFGCWCSTLANTLNRRGHGLCSN